MRTLMLFGSVGSRRGLIVQAGLVAFVGFVVTLTLCSDPDTTPAQAGSVTNTEVASSTGRLAVPATDTVDRTAAAPEVKQAAPAAEAPRRDKPTPVSRAAARQRRLLNRLLAPGRFAYHEMVRRIAERYRVEHRLVMAIIASESGGNPEAVSPAGAIGLMQLMPETAERLGVDPWDPEQNIEGAVRYLAKQLSTFDSVDLSLVAYNAGPGFAEEYRRGHVELGAETRAFLTRVGQMLQ